MPAELVVVLIASATVLVGAFTKLITSATEERVKSRQYDLDREQYFNTAVPKLEQQNSEIWRVLNEERQARIKNEGKWAVERLELQTQIANLTKEVEDLRAELAKQETTNELLQERVKDLDAQRSALLRANQKLERELSACMGVDVSTSQVMKAVKDDESEESE